MKLRFSIVDGQRREPDSGLTGECPVCGEPTIAKCGEIKVWHWAHKTKRNCDHWWENETEWHRSWKNLFPGEWQEAVQWAEDGEKHVADVKTDQDWVIEFQHSYIDSEERRSREAFYGNMVWIVDGLRRKNDLKKFSETIRDHGVQISQDPPIWNIFPSFSRLVMDWITSQVPVFFDFGGRADRHILSLLIPMGPDSNPLVVPVRKEHFIDWHLKGDFDLQQFIRQVRDYELSRKRAQSRQADLTPLDLIREQARRRRAWRQRGGPRL
jgi:competence protein CoiA